MHDDLVFKALADPTRRRLLDALFERDGRSLGELEAVVNEHTEMSRFGVAKHLRLLEGADLVITRRSGRERLHYLNPVPIRAIYDRWIDKYTEGRVRALTDLRRRAEGHHERDDADPRHLHRRTGRGGVEGADDV
ncbi:ArsR/SmtB family transcription factor [Cellulomonas bogoriensis]|uniref:ArsR family transcriptional regulator n=1 Tax=Cellulomonas bogoriensis 69B4 = DSM 16987 TaxID=1386082 RepID=A0A0A0BNM2_9CELL|nr:metalloregulator ArsR/SmtB family transcription factor [Cellulomonas bogoriensis]KGM09227.1 ArsR family transcriptional regulator [Cellulomonas bogoriensis 69B4 = DSM 16987]